jgi:hypothetical protein
LHGELDCLTSESQAAGGVDEVGTRSGMGPADVQHILFEIDLGIDMRVPDEVDNPLFALLVGEVERFRKIAEIS